MSYIRWIPPKSFGHAPEPGRSVWRLFPWLVAASMGVVVVVNAGMIFAALASFPGKTGNDGFDLSNQYDAVLDHAQRAAELGWTMLARTDGTGRPEVTLTDRQGSPLTGASVAAAAERPLGAPETQRLVFHETDAGRYVADTALPLRGQWDLTLSASAGASQVAATRRIIVR
jgi:nitrogen fixation protein FixH